jgi:regulator of protease activity HflC (stomatin/prohibitin superfamily)
MAQIVRFFGLRHLRAEPNQHILHHRDGALVRQGPGLSFWFNPLSAALAQLPVEDCATTFVLRERTADFQEVTVQCTLIYRVADPVLAASRVNFSLSPQTGAWFEAPLERLASLWALRAQPPARAYLASVPVVEALRRGPETVREAVLKAMHADPEIEAMGLQLVDMQVDRAAPTAEVEKALQTPTRESIQQKADEATFARRALAVEKERAIKENELGTEIELARRTEDLIRQQASNRQLEVETEATAKKARAVAAVERKAILAEGAARDRRTAAEAEAAAEQLLSEARAAGEQRRVEVWREAPNKVVVGLALQEFARHLQSIQHLNLTPDLLGQSLQQFLTERAGG